MGVTTTSSMSAMAATLGAHAIKCCVCGNALHDIDGDDMENQICGNCEQRPDAARRIKAGAKSRSIRLLSAGETPAIRAFTPADKSLINKLHGYMPARQLLDLLNERLAGDIGAGALSYTKAQLHEEIQAIKPGAPKAQSGAHDWPSLRKLLAKARKDGVLKSINEQVINDFAVVFSLNPKQVSVLKDIVLQARKD